MDLLEQKPLQIHYVSSTDSTEFSRLTWALNRSSVVGLDAEWKPNYSYTRQSPHPTVLLLQIACRVEEEEVEIDSQNNSWVFLLDLLAIPLPSIWELLMNMFTSPDILKLGFMFKQDFIYLSSTFHSQGCDPSFDKVEPFLDIASIYNYLHCKQSGEKQQRKTKGLAAICEEVLGVSLSKELQCSDWSCRPLTEEQKTYAALDAHCLLEIFIVFQGKVNEEGNSLHSTTELHSPKAALGLKQIFEKPNIYDNISRLTFCEASDTVRSTALSEIHPGNHIVVGSISRSCRNNFPLDESLSKIIRKYGEKILLNDLDRKPRNLRKKGEKFMLKDSDRKPRKPRKKGKKQSFVHLQGPLPWDLSLGGDGCPKFLCDVMVISLAKHLRYVGIDAAVPSSGKPKPSYRQLIDQAHKEKRVLLMRDSDLLEQESLMRNQVYTLKSLHKNDQLLEIIETFQLKICKDPHMSRCIQCNGRFIQKPLTTEEAIAAAKGFQEIPNCLLDRNLKFWQCTDCSKLFWGGARYQKIIKNLAKAKRTRAPVRGRKTSSSKSSASGWGTPHNNSSFRTANQIDNEVRRSIILSLTYDPMVSFGEFGH